MTRPEHGKLFVYVARYGDYDEDRSTGLGFTTDSGAKDWIDSVHTTLGDDAEWERVDSRTERAEDKIGNWAMVEKVRISDPEGLLAFDNRDQTDSRGESDR